MLTIRRYFWRCSSQQINYRTAMRQRLAIELNQALSELIISFNATAAGAVSIQ